MNNRDRLIVGLDLPSTDEARAAVARLDDAVVFYKIGLQLFPVGGLDLARELIAGGKRVFLDFKFYDIPATVERATVSVRDLDADFLTVHGDAEIMKGAVKGAQGSSLKILAVTVLTSLSQDGLRALGFEGAVEDLVLRRAEAAAQAGCHGVVASPLEAAAIKKRFADALTIVTPGVRPQGAERNDQTRVATPTDALAAGADYLVMSRPILSAPDPAAAARAIQAEISTAS